MDRRGEYKEGVGDGNSRKKGGGTTREYVPRLKETERGNNSNREGVRRRKGKWFRTGAWGGGK